MVTRLHYYPKFGIKCVKINLIHQLYDSFINDEMRFCQLQSVMIPCGWCVLLLAMVDGVFLCKPCGWCVPLLAMLAGVFL